MDEEEETMFYFTDTTLVQPRRGLIARKNEAKRLDGRVQTPAARKDGRAQGQHQIHPYSLAAQLRTVSNDSQREKVTTHLIFERTDYLPFQIPPPSPQGPQYELEEHAKKGKPVVSERG